MVEHDFVKHIIRVLGDDIIYVLRNVTLNICGYFKCLIHNNHLESTTYLFEAKTKAESEIKDLKSENQKLKSIIEQHKNEKVNIKFKYYLRLIFHKIIYYNLI